MKNTIQKIKQRNRDEFEKKFPDKDFLSLGLGGNIPLYPVSREEILLFLSLAEDRIIGGVAEEIKKWIREKKCPESCKREDFLHDGYKEALQDLRGKLKEIK